MSGLQLRDGLVEVDWNTVSTQPAISHYDPVMSQGSQRTSSQCSTAAASIPPPSRQLPSSGQLHHYPPPAQDRASTRQRTLRRPLSSNATPTSAAAKQFNAASGTSQSFAAPLRPMTLPEFQEALRRLALDDPNIEDRIRSLTSHLQPELFNLIEPIRLNSSSASSFVEAVLLLKKHRRVRQGFGLTLEEFKERVRKDCLDSDHGEDLVLQWMKELGPETQAAVREKFVMRSSLQHFCDELESIGLPSGGNVAFSSKYVNAVLETLMEMDGSIPMIPFFDLVQNEVTQKMRFILAEWLFDVCIRFKFCPETIFLALALTDRYMMVQRIPRSEAQLVGVAALVIASKYEEVYPPEVKDFVYMSANAFTNGDIIRMERQVFVRLQFGVTVATLNSISTALLAEQDPKPCELQAMICYYICVVMVVATHLGQHSQANLAATAVYMSRMWCEVPTGEPSAEVLKLLPMAVSLVLSISPITKLGATVYNYFAAPAQLHVSTLVMPDTLTCFSEGARAPGL